MASEKEKQISAAESYFYKTYNRYPVIFDHGEGVYLYDSEGKAYLDFGAGIAVNGLGYGDPEYTAAIQGQAGKLLHVSNLYYNEPSIAAAQKLLKASGMDRVFFTNSGTEAVEGALKVAKRYAFNKDGKGDHEIIAMRHSFHGRSLGSLSVTGNDHYQKPFMPLIPGIKFATFNDLFSVKQMVNDRTCAIILETIQGEGGIHPAEADFLEGVGTLCKEKGILLILDEIQCGMGRTGEMFAWQNYGVKPDVMTVAKALGNGLPIGAFLARGEAAQAMVPGDHGATYGGNPMVCAGADAVLSIFEKRNITEHVKKTTPYLEKALDEVVEIYEDVVERRGMGFMQGLEFSVPVAEVVTTALVQEGLVLISAGNTVIRFVPPLIIEEKHIDEMKEKLCSAIKGAGLK
ncbi:MAG: aspartate aminotransferase family protein [Lachnospiraceae bacterium]|jgi:acetylornithine/N-succinyldiaminopimelate aminotransferase|nr:aspartate aminotransferase family protein [Lachnospiraceae bacterium]